jgi:hypothetical protein
LASRCVAVVALGLDARVAVGLAGQLVVAAGLALVVARVALQLALRVEVLLLGDAPLVLLLVALRLGRPGQPRAATAAT